MRPANSEHRVLGKKHNLHRRNVACALPRRSYKHTDQIGFALTQKRNCNRRINTLATSNGTHTQKRLKTFSPDLMQCVGMLNDPKLIDERKQANANGLNYGNAHRMNTRTKQQGNPVASEVNRKSATAKMADPNCERRKIAKCTDANTSNDAFNKFNKLYLSARTAVCDKKINNDQICARSCSGAHDRHIGKKADLCVRREIGALPCSKRIKLHIFVSKQHFPISAVDVAAAHTCEMRPACVSCALWAIGGVAQKVPRRTK